MENRPAQKTVQAVEVAPLERTAIPEPPAPVSHPSRAEMVTAAQSWIDASYYAPDADRWDLLLRSAAALIEARRLSEAKRILDAVDTSGLPARYIERKRLLRIQLALAGNRLELASRYLARYRRSSALNPEFRTQILGLSAQAYLRSNQALPAVGDLLRREQYLLDPAELRDNREMIWHALGAVTDIELQIARQSSDNAALSDWLDLALLFDEFGADPHRLRQTLGDWVQINPFGSAQTFASDMLRMTGPPATARGAPIIKAALLLPLASRFGAAAQAVYNGFTAMQTLDGNPLKPEVVVYDIGEIPELANSYYQLAVDEGANLIIGPLGKQAAAAIVDNRRDSDVPTILLGGVGQGSTLPANTYQIDLAPEHEAAQTATRAYSDGHRVAAIMSPDSDWGQRVSQAFTAQWQSLGGIVASAQVYDEAANDHSLAIKQMLDLNASENRRSALSALLNTRPEFRPRRRQDLDVVFLAARPESGRLIKPQLNFYLAHDIPVYSTSHIFSGTRDIVNDADLDRIVFGDMPWLLRDDSRSTIIRSLVEADHPPQAGLERLFALGMDAYLLSRVIPYLEPGTPLMLKGVSGDRLVIGKSGQIERHLEWARFENGAPALIDDMEVTFIYEDIQTNTSENSGAASEKRQSGGATGASLPY